MADDPQAMAPESARGDLPEPDRRGVVLGIDFGTVRIGVAVSDSLGLLARPLETIDVRSGIDPVERIAAIAAERAVHTTAVGWPLRMDGTEGGAVERVRAFVDRLRSRCPDLRVVEIDERLTTREAEEILSQNRRGRRRTGHRPFRDVVDQTAAVLILQDYLDQHAPLPPPELDPDEPPPDHHR